MQTPETEAQVNRLMPGTELITSTGGRVPSSGTKDEQSPGDGGEAQPPEDSSMAPAENVATVDDDDATEVELVTRLEELLATDVELSARYRALLRDHRTTGRERRTLRAELRRLHTEEGAILLEVKLHRARKGRGGGWAEFLRQRKPKRMGRTTADRWIKWYLDSKEQRQSQSETAPGQAPENAPQNESGAFSCGNGPAPPPLSGAQTPVPAGAPPVNCSETFEDVQQVILLLKKSQAAHFRAAAEYLVAKNGYETLHQAIYVTLTEAAARVGFVYPTTVAEEGETTSVSEGANP